MGSPTTLLYYTPPSVPHNLGLPWDNEGFSKLSKAEDWGRRSANNLNTQPDDKQVKSDKAQVEEDLLYEFQGLAPRNLVKRFRFQTVLCFRVSRACRL